MKTFLKFGVLVITSCLLSSVISAQTETQLSKKDTNTINKEYPFVLPIWGQKLTDRNIDFQLPFGLNINYVYNQMSLELTHFSMNFYDGENLDDIINPETLNFTSTVATANGVNVRADAWIFPFLNVYGLYSKNSGSTQVTFQPQAIEYGLGANGNLKKITTLENPIELDPVNFTSNTGGIGMTTAYGWNNYFISVDGNMTWSSSDLLKETVTFFVGSARIGRVIPFKNGMKLSVYFGAMYRDFVNKEMNTGSLGVPELDEGMKKAVDGLAEINQQEIDDLEDKAALTPRQQERLDRLNQRQVRLVEASDRIENSNAINYSIKKEIIDNWSTQVGFNYEITPNFMFRGELGYRAGQKFFMTGLQYRFGL